MLSPHMPNPERERIARLMEDYERSHTVTTTPILVRDPKRAAFMETGIRNGKGR